MKKRLLSLTLIAALCLSLLPVTALAAGEDAPDTLLVDGIDVTNGGYWTTNNGSLTQTQSTTEWNVHYDTSTNILNLNNATIKNDASDQNSNGAAIYAAGDAGQDVTLTIKVEGSNVISGAHGIYMLGESSSEENPSLSLSIEKAANATNASLEITGTDNGIILSNDGSKSLSISDVDVTASGGENGAGVYMSGSGGDSCSLSVSGCTLTTSGGTGIACVDAQDNSTLSTTVTLQNHAIVDARQGGLKGSIESFEIAPEFGGLLYDQQTIHVLGAFTLAENMTIGEDVTLYVDDKGYPGALTIPEDGTLTNNGTVTILGDSRLINKGTITNNGTVTVSGGSALTNNGTLCNYGTLTGEIDGNGTVIPTYTFNYPKTLTLTASGSGFYTASDTLSLSEESDLGQAKVVVYGTNKAELNTLTLSKEDDPSQTIPFTINGVSKSNPYSAYLDKNQTKVFAVLDGETGEDAYTIEVLCEILDMKEVLSGTYTGTFNLYVGYTTDENVEFDDVVENVDLNQLTRCTVTVKLENNLGLGITTQPSDVTVDEGNAATFNVVASGDIQSYQWQVNSGNGWSAITDATDASYTIDRTTTAMSGNQYRCIVIGDGGETTSSAATLTVRPYEPPYTGKYSYEIVSDVGENGTIDVDRYATEGDQVTITVTPDEAYLLDDLTVTSGGRDVALTDNGDGTYTFTMPSGDVAITATFAEDPNWEEPEDPATDVSEIFTDVPANHWAQAAIQYVYDNGLMTGVSDTAFAPEATTIRAMIVSMLARLENVTSAADAGFSDVTADDWYATAVNWAAANGIVSGISDDTFAPNDPITREQLAAMLMNYAQWKGQDISARADLSHYSDAENISSWANDVLSWAVAEGLLTGVTDDQLQPQAATTRAQTAAVFQRFLTAESLENK